MKHNASVLAVSILVLWTAATHAAAAAKTVDLFSPGKTVAIRITLADSVSYTVIYQGRKFLAPSLVSLTLQGGQALGKPPRLLDVKRRSADEKIRPPVREKRAVVRDVYNEAVLTFQGNYGLVFRAYDDGVAYRFFTRFKGPVKVENEEVSFRFVNNGTAHMPFEESFLSSFEKPYVATALSQVTDKKMAYIPVFIEFADGTRAAIAESDVDDYPGLYLCGSPDGSPSLFGLFPAYPLKEEQRRDRTMAVVERADYIADTSGTRDFPWRIIMLGVRDGDLVENDLVYRLAKPLQLSDTSWIRPGKVAWDWWNALNLSGVDFEAGINTATYKYYVDFASRHGIKYVILDEGWSDPADLFKINPEIDMPALLAHAKEKKVGLILWCVWITLDSQLERALDLFAQWGVAGIKVDFMDRDDQKMVNFYRKIAREAAARKLIVDFHGAFKPTGLRREYPNVLTREGVMGLENSKWSPKVTPEHDVVIPFTRMLAGPMDYTPGAMRNASKENFRPVFSEPMSQGTRAHQLAMFVVYESPLQMLCDAPTSYEREPEMMNFLARVPTVWDETRVLDGKIGDFIIVARRSGREWYVGAMTDWTPRELVLDLSFLGPGEHTAEVYADGPNASRAASDWTKETLMVRSGDKLTVKLAPGGGWAARIF